MSKTTTREQIVKAADELFYRRGYEHTSFSDIAAAVKISRGNFYYHFKSKDEILEAVIARRQADTRAKLQRWEREGVGPQARIERFVDIVITNRAKIMRYGCPVGTLCAELAKLDNASQAEANAIFTQFREWLREQFTQLGRETDSDDLAMHLLARSQGIASLATVFRDEAFIRQEVEQMHAWLRDQIPPGRHDELAPR